MNIGGCALLGEFVAFPAVIHLETLVPSIYSGGGGLFQKSNLELVTHLSLDVIRLYFQAICPVCLASYGLSPKVFPPIFCFHVLLTRGNEGKEAKE